MRAAARVGERHLAAPELARGVWRYLEEDGVSASAGLAVDEHLMTLARPALRLYTYHSHAALVGKFQNLEAEIDVGFCRERGIAMNRRPTGGGAILMGEDQLGIAIVDASTEHAKELFARYGAKLVAGLERLGIAGRLEAKNDIRVNGRKIAGLGVCRNERGWFLFHASLIVDLDVDLMLRVLKIPAEKLSDKLRSRVEENVTTVRRELGSAVSVGEVRAALRGEFDVEAAPLAAEERAGATELEREKYVRDSWIYQRVPAPDMTGTAVRKTPAGLLRLYLSLAGGRFKDVTITGDFVTDEDRVLALEKRLVSLPAEEAVVRDAVREHGLADDFVPAIMDAVASAREAAPYGCFVRC